MSKKPDLIWIVGPEKAAARKRGGKFWTVLEKNSNDPSLSVQKAHRNFSFGVYFNLNRSNKKQASDPSSSRSALILSTYLPSISTWLAFLALFVIAALAFTGHITAKNLFGTSDFYFPTDLEDFGLVFLTAIGSSITFLSWEGGLLSKRLNPGALLIGYSKTGPAIDPVVWRLGTFVLEAWFTVLLPILVIWCAWSWRVILGPISIGLLLGAWLYLLPALYPLRSGAGSTILEGLARVKDIPSTLKWALTTRFLPAGQQIQAGRGKIMVAMALALVLWIVFVTQSFNFIANLIPAEGFIAVLWQPIFNFGGFFFLLWFLFQLMSIYRSALELRGKGSLEKAEPSEAQIQAFEEHNALLAHLPELKSLKWTWWTAPAGTFLIRYGETERSFYWLASGEAKVLGRNPAGDVVHWANIHDGSGVGEIALLENVSRTADVFLTKSSVLCKLEQKEFASIETPELRLRFEELVHAGQAFDNSRIFKKVPSSDKERWLTKGKPVRISKGESIIDEGSSARWMGLVVQGDLDVEKNGEKVAQLTHGDIFGEMAFLTMKKRSATLRANTPVLVWRWEASFLDERVDALGIRDSLTQMAEGRKKSSEKGDQ